MSLDSRIKLLIAIGVSVGANCLPCVELHVAKAREIGISEQEIGEAIEVGKTVRKGAAYRMDQFIAELQEKAVSDKPPEDKGCGCGGGPACC